MSKRPLLLIALFALTLASCPLPHRPVFQLAFASDRAGHGDIFLLDERGGLTNLTSTPHGEWAPRWSPDGRQIAYTGYAAGQADIWLFELATGRQRNLSRHPADDYAPTWSPDGRQLAFISERDGDAELFIQAVAAGEAIQLTHNDYPEKQPAWSPDGNQIAFAAIEAGLERLYLLDLNRDNRITPLLYSGEPSGTGPAWSPSGEQLVFVGWDSSRTIGIYLLNTVEWGLEKVYSTETWIGSLNWAGDGRWLFFTGRAGPNHELFALDLQTGRTHRLTAHRAWDDFPALRPGQPFAPPPPTTVAPLPEGDGFAYGVNLADLSNAVLVRDMGFNYLKGYLNRATVEIQPGTYRWTDPDNVVKAASQAGVQVLLRIHGSPAWARPPETVASHPPTDLAAFERFMRAVAARYRGRVAAYEIWNEPNLNYEWGYRPPSAAEYTALLQSAYRAVKAEDPTALVVSGGLAPTGGGRPPETIGDLDFIEGMYRAGAKGYFDALGSHPYSYGRPPDLDRPDELTLARVTKHREIMRRHLDGDRPIWITELGWVLETDWDLGEYHSQGVNLLEQAAYLRRAYERIDREWPYVEAAFLFNLDFSAAPWYPASEQMRWYAILNPDRTPRPAFTELRGYRVKHATPKHRSPGAPESGRP